MKEARTFFLIFLLGTVSRIISAACPPEEKISPCICSEGEDDVDLYISCSHVGLNFKEAKRIIGALDKKSTYAVDLEEMDIGTLPYNFFEGLKVKQLTISHCRLDRLSEEGKKPLSGLENTLKELSIYYSFSEENVMTKVEVSHLRVLSKLDLSYNSITELGDDWFEKGPVSLTHLILTKNDIEKLGSKAFQNLVNLRELWIDGDRFGAIERSMFPSPAKHLQDLQLDNNALTSLPSDMFQGMPSLKSVSLRTNGISQIPKETWQPVWEQLEWIDLRGNPLLCDSHIEWIFQENTLAIVSGRCSAPHNRQGVDLEELANEK